MIRKSCKSILNLEENEGNASNVSVCFQSNAVSELCHFEIQCQ